MRYWINTVSLDHVLLGVEGGFTQADHGRATRLAKIEKGDVIALIRRAPSIPPARRCKRSPR
ncbi:MAG: hypothetical protein ABI854_01355 [Betaproteobacteria bacterium]